MTPDDPRHGTYAGVQAHVSTNTPHCEPCLVARRRYQKRLEVDHSRGTRRRIALDIAQRHVKRLIDAGIPVDDIARRAQVSPRTVYRAAGMVTDSTHMTTTATAKLLSVTPDAPPEIGYIPRHGAVRRLQALVAMGHPITYLADRLGSGRANLSGFLHGKRSDTRPNRHIQASTWRKIAELYLELHMTPGPSQQSRNRALRNGWAPPMAWDDIDDPDATPTGHLHSGRTTEANATRAHELEHLIWMGATLHTAANTLGITIDALGKWCRQHGERDLYQRLREQTPDAGENQHTRSVA